MDKKKEIVCIAQHIKAYVEQCKHGERARFSKACLDCRFNLDCDFDAWKYFQSLSKRADVLITPLITKQGMDHEEHPCKSDNR